LWKLSGWKEGRGGLYDRGEGGFIEEYVVKDGFIKEETQNERLK